MNYNKYYYVNNACIGDAMFSSFAKVIASYHFISLLV